MELLKKVLNRLKNKKIALAVASGVLMLLVNMGIISTDMMNEYMDSINIVLTILMAVGVLSNPDKDTTEQTEE